MSWPLLFIVIWWSGWLTIANLGLTNFFPLSFDTNLSVILLVAGLLSGGLFFHLFKASTKVKQKKEVENNITNQHDLEKMRKFVYLTVKIAIPVSLYFLYKFIHIINDVGILNYRSSVFTADTGESVLFGTRYIEFLYFDILGAAVFLSTPYSIILFFKRKIKTPLVAIGIISLINSIITFGRFSIYEILVLFIFIFFLISRHDFNKMLKDKFVFILFAVLIGVTFIVSLARGLIMDDDNYNLMESIGEHLVETHTVGFSLFDIALSDKNSTINTESSLGKGTFAGIDYLISQVIRQFDKTYENFIIYKDHAERYKFIEVGDNKVFNAYYTILYTLYADGGMIYIFLFSVICGFYLEKKTDEYARKKLLRSALTIIFVFYMFYFSIFMSMLENSPFETAIILNFFILKTNMLSCAYKAQEQNMVLAS